MSVYEMMKYDRMLERVGIKPGDVWYCGDNVPPDVTYDSSGAYDGVGTYTGYGQKSASFCLSSDINVNGLLLNHRDGNGTVWLCTGIDGWWTLPPSEIPDVPQPYWDGSLLTTGRYLPRTITVNGVFIPPDKSLTWYNRNVLMQVGSIVRGSGLIALCGNESPDNPQMLDGVDDDGNPYEYFNPLYDPPKMAIIQMADVPLIDTTKTSGYTVFSLSFKCVQPSKLSVYEKNAALVVPDSGFNIVRRYHAFSTSTAEGDPDTTEYSELLPVPDSTALRTYEDVQKASLDSLISGEELTDPGGPTRPGHPNMDYYVQAGGAGQPIPHTIVHNAGNYFAFPIFVFGSVSGANSSSTLTVTNFTTKETMTIQKNVPADRVLVVDTGLRRVAVVNPASDPTAWIWNDRSTLSLTSQWISLAPGDNTFITNKTGTTSVPQSPKVYWRDTWIG